MKVLFGADLVPTAMSEKFFINGDVETLFSDVLPLMKDADRVIVNLECALTETDGAIPKIGPNIKAHPNSVEGLKQAGITDVLLSNNHVFDYGVDGLMDTIRTLNAAGIPYTGIGNNDTESRKIYYIVQEGKKLAIVNVCEHEYSYALPQRMGANPFDPFLTMQDVREAKHNADFVVVVYHGGKEHCRYPSPRLRNLCQELVLNGADLVLCQHSHCIGCYEEYATGKILYGQGNFHFVNDKGNEMWDTGMLVEVNVTDSLKLNFYPFKANGATISLAKGDLYARLMQEFAQRNEELQNGKWKEGWHAFCESVKWYNGVVYDLTATSGENTRQLFSHFLDCEAHTDVWREMFTTWNQTNELEKSRDKKIP